MNYIYLAKMYFIEQNKYKKSNLVEIHNMTK